MLGLLGISYNSAPLEIREKFAFSQADIIPFSEHLSEKANFNDIVVLSTCNRMEIYFSQDLYSDEIAFRHVKSALLSFKNQKLHISNYSYSLSNENVVKHLFRVTSGVDSMVIGEDQIIGQVKDAYLYCTQAALTDAVLMRLFQKSFEAGKRVRTETKIKQGATSVSYVAVDLCVNTFGDLKNKSIFLIGAGETTGLALQGLHKKGAKNILIANRTLKNSQELAQRYTGSVVSFDRIHENLSKADIVIVATAASDPVIDAHMVELAQKEREGKFQLYLDLSVPRNIAEEVKNISSIKLSTVDDLQEVIKVNTENRKKCIADAEIIINEVCDELMEWISFRALRPAIRAIKYNLQKIHKDERMLYTNTFNADERKVIDAYSEKLITKYERALIKNLKTITQNGKNTEYLSLINKLFLLE